MIPLQKWGGKRKEPQGNQELEYLYKSEIYI